MSKPVNLNQMRKAKARAEAKAQADANAVKFGRSKAQRLAEDTAKAQTERKLDGHKRTDG